MRYYALMDKRNFDDLTDLVEYAQQVTPESQTSPATDRHVENAQGELITLDDKMLPDVF